MGGLALLNVNLPKMRAIGKRVEARVVQGVAWLWGVRWRQPWGALSQEAWRLSSQIVLESIAGCIRAGSDVQLVVN
jgi:hypothetical protein